MSHDEKVLGASDAVDDLAHIIDCYHCSGLGTVFFGEDVAYAAFDVAYDFIGAVVACENLSEGGEVVLEHIVGIFVDDEYALAHIDGDCTFHCFVD